MGHSSQEIMSPYNEGDDTLKAEVQVKENVIINSPGVNREMDMEGIHDLHELDSVQIDRRSYWIGLLKAVALSSIAVLAFFVQFEINGKSDIMYGHIYKGLAAYFGIVGYWIVNALIAGNALLGIYGKYFAKQESALGKYYSSDTPIHLIMYSLGAFFMMWYVLYATFEDMYTPGWLIAMGDTVIPPVVVGVAFIIIVGAFFIPFLVSFGGIDFVGTLLEPIVRPVFKVPGKSIVDMITSFVGSTSIAVLITSKLYRIKTYTQREAVVIATGFSAVSIGYALLGVNLAGLGEHFVTVYASALVITFLVSIIIVRLPIISNMKDEYIDGEIQTEEARKNDAKIDRYILKRAISRAAKKGYMSNSVFSEVRMSLKEGIAIMPKVLPMLCSVGILGMIIAEYTPIFKWLGFIFLPILMLFGVPDAAMIAGSVPLGITEQLLPILVISEHVDSIAIGARYFVVVLSMVQIIFFSESVVVMLATKLPVKIGQIVLLFIIRTLIAIPIVALAMHLFF